MYGWQSNFTDILLEDVGAVMVARLSHRWMLFVVGVCIEMMAWLARALTLGNLEPVEMHRQIASTLLFLGAFLVVTFGVQRFSLVQISSQRATIGFRIASDIRNDIKRFLLDLDHARMVWYLEKRIN